MTSGAGGGGAVQWSDLSEHFGELARLLIPEGVPLTPERLVLAAHDGAPHAESAGLTLLPQHGPPRTLAWSTALARNADELQYRSREGPCLTAAEHDDVIRVDDLSVDDRWPIFASRVVAEYGVRSMACLSLHLAGSGRAALNLYATRPHALNDRDIAVGAIFASFIALALQAEQARAQVANLETALTSSRQIGTAIGILMARGLLTADQAFDQLRDASQQLNRKLREVALEVVDTGELPVVPRHGRPEGNESAPLE